MKTFPKSSQLPDVTIGVLISKVQYWEMLHSERCSKKYENANEILAIYAIGGSLTRITCYPIVAPVIWKIKIEFKEVSDCTAMNVSAELKNHKIIHTTGLSKKGEAYRMENYIEGGSPWKKAKQIVSRISKIKEVKRVEIELVEET